jgi:hypothetical protein
MQMHRLNTKSRVGITLAVAATLAACGGGGGSSNDNPPSQETPVITITEANAAVATAEALDAGSAGSTTDDKSIGAQKPSVGLTSVLLADAMGRGAQRIARDRSAAARERPASTEACTGGGTVDVTATTASDTEPTVGDTVLLDYNDCVEGTVTFNGKLNSKVVDFNDASLTYLVTDSTATAFVLSLGSEGRQLDGTLRLTVDRTVSDLVKVGIKSSALTVRRLDASGAVVATRALSAYELATTTTISTGNRSVIFQYDVSGNFPGLGDASFSARTNGPLVSAGSATHPGAGLAQVTGENSSVSITALTDGAQLDIDEDGDGTTDSTLTPTWEALDAELN